VTDTVKIEELPAVLLMEFFSQRVYPLAWENAAGAPVAFLSEARINNFSVTSRRHLNYASPLPVQVEDRVEVDG